MDGLDLSSTVTTSGSAPQTTTHPNYGSLNAIGQSIGILGITAGLSVLVIIVPLLLCIRKCISLLMKRESDFTRAHEKRLRNESYSSPPVASSPTTPLNTNQYEGKHQQQNMPPQAPNKASGIPEETDQAECYDTLTPTLSPTASQFKLDSNQCYDTTTPTVDPDQLYETVEGGHQQQDMELTHNQVYATTSDIPVDTNQCYGTTTPSVSPDQLYETVEGDTELMYEQVTTPTSIPQTIEMDSNRCYGTTTSSFSYNLNATPITQEDQRIELMSQTEDDDYIIP